MRGKAGRKRLYGVVRFNRRILAFVLVAAVAAGLCTAAVALHGADGAAGTDAAINERQNPSASPSVSPASEETEGVEIPIVMYHSVLKDRARLGKYVISPDEFESDLKYLKDNGYTTILMEDLINYTQGGELPEKPVLLTFDDGYYNNYLYAFELAKQYEAKFVISPIGFYADQYTDTPDENAYYSHATWPQLQEMRESGLVEIENHSYNLHKSNGSRLGVKKVSGETDAQYEKMLTEDVLKAQEEIEGHVGVRPTTFVYPFGAVSKGTPEIIRKLGFTATLSCEEHISTVTRDPESLFDLGRYLRVSGPSSEKFFEKTMKLKA